uniref:Uncharacterized protein n=1 Tax=Chromera velia CCMP2878 TaxID=1169474 RepID=A0A0G4HMM4_9ALVE|eukprot:Cvel_7507.t1-p1 / transcript=Cvel_7507.t1 / gene=Cvel_7507 / organism=Chromera_velia_CCMP2878 / gene_product=hypothetical protein / transcript_product=hypothetical protein / location=Cvel_scaffold394:48138-53380(+) / protein_length=193 / sequence_SO=supercontig / SO=protein_coding / is_pseudo=false
MATPVQTHGDGGKEEKGSGHAVVIPSKVPPSRCSGGGDTETRALGAEGVVVVESMEVAVTVDDLESGRSTGAMKREKCSRHVIETTNSSTWGAESFEEGDQNTNGSGVCALYAGTPSNPEGGGLPHSAVADKILSRCLRKDLNARGGVDAKGPTGLFEIQGVPETEGAAGEVPNAAAAVAAAVNGTGDYGGGP